MIKLILFYAGVSWKLQLMRNAEMQFGLVRAAAIGLFDAPGISTIQRKIDYQAYGFDERTALVLDRNAGPGSPWAKVMSHYSLRNQIAHGTLLAQRIDVDAVTQEFFQIRSALQE